VTLSKVYVAIATHSAIVLLADAARPWLENEQRSTLVRRILSLLLVGIAVWLFAVTRRSLS
jgi:threonine/homoserine/homoserine lactone efflux protein